MNKEKGFTLVELLAVIAVLGLILIIAVPKITRTIEISKKRTLELTAKSIARSAEEKKIENATFGINEEITCDNISDYSKDDFSLCAIYFNEDGMASVTLTGRGSYKGLNVCNGTKVKASATSENCPTNFEDDEWSTIVASVKSGNHPYQVGDSKTIDLGRLGEHTIRVANTTSCSKVDVVSQTACGFVLEFVDAITNAKMNDPSTNVGGWPASAMRKYLNDIDTTSEEDGIIYNLLPEELRNGIIETYVISSHGLEDAGTIGNNKNFYSTDKLYLLSAEEVWSQGDSNTIDYDTSRETSRQLDYYANYKGEGYTGVSTSNYTGATKKNGSSDTSWWLRSTQSSYRQDFYFVGNNGDWDCTSSSTEYGVSPAFRLSN